MSTFDTLGYEEIDGVAWVTLDRPQVRNAFNTQMMQELHGLWRSLRTNDDVRVIVLTGAGDDAFCVGVDRMDADPGNRERQTFLGQQGGSPMHYDDPSDYLPPKSSADLWKPVIAAVNGMACGGAFYLLGEADFIISADTATFFDPHTTFGMAAVFEPMYLARRMPIGEVLRLALMGSHERMSAQRAYEVGLVQEVVPAGDLHKVVQEVASALASQPALSTQATVRAIWYAAELGHRQTLEVGKMLVQLGNDDGLLAEGQQAFLGKKRPQWRLR